MSAPLQALQAAYDGAANKLRSALTWVTDTGRLYIAEEDGEQYPVSGMEVHEFTFTETTGVDSTYTATLVVPAGYTVYDILFGNTVLWDAATTASLIVGDGDDADGYYAATNVKTTPAVPTGGNWGFNLHDDGNVFTDGKYYAAEGLITAVITTDDNGTHEAGRSRMAVYMSPGSKTVTAATKAAV
jgi:hypothetical protein